MRKEDVVYGMSMAIGKSTANMLRHSRTYEIAKRLAREVPYVPEISQLAFGSPETLLNDKFPGLNKKLTFPDGKNVQMVVFGDSIVTADVPHTTFDSIITEQVTKSGKGNWRAVNRAAHHATSDEILAQLDNPEVFSSLTYSDYELLLILSANGNNFSDLITSEKQRDKILSFSKGLFTNLNLYDMLPGFLQVKHGYGRDIETFFDRVADMNQQRIEAGKPAPSVLVIPPYDYGLTPMAPFEPRDPNAMHLKTNFPVSENPHMSKAGTIVSTAIIQELGDTLNKVQSGHPEISFVTISPLGVEKYHNGTVHLGSEGQWFLAGRVSEALEIEDDGVEIVPIPSLFRQSYTTAA